MKITLRELARRVRWFGAAAGVGLAMAALAGCQTAGKLTHVRRSSVCPECKTEVRTASIRGATYENGWCQ